MRTHIILTTTSEAAEFVRSLNGDGTTDKYILTTADGKYTVNARSLLGVVYMSAEHCTDTYLVNETRDGVYPYQIDVFRAE